MPVAYELDPAVVAAQEAYTAAQRDQESVSVRIEEWLARRTDGMSRRDALVTREIVMGDPPQDLDRLQVEWRVSGRVAGELQLVLEQALRDAVERLHPEVVAKQRTLADCEAELRKSQAALEESNACGDDAKVIEELAGNVARLNVAVNRARRDLRQQIEKDGLG
jgi:hypothetical protein